MKKLFFLIAFTFCLNYSFGQTFTYVATNVQADGIASWSADSMTVTYPYIVTVGIKGDEYGFVNPKPCQFKFTLSSKEAKSPETLNKYAWSKADEYVQENFPSK